MHRFASVFVAVGLCCAGLVAPWAAQAEVPDRIALQGVLRTAGGAPVPDGQYLLVVGLYAQQQGGQPLYEAVLTGTPVQGGVFQFLLGEKKPFDVGLFLSGTASWVGLAVAGEPELPREPLLRVPYAMRAAEAAGLACTGCVGSAQLDPAVLAPYVKKSDLANHAQLDAANTFSAVNTFTSRVGIGKGPAIACALDVGTDSGAVCVDGQPALVTRFAKDQGAMANLAQPGQIIYRTDEKALYAHVAGMWRKVQFQVVCGDGALEAPEQCDNGPANADLPDKCRTTCQLPMCGDKIQDKAEQCDDGNAIDTDACIACMTAKCGDSHVQADVEQCDDGNPDSTDTCIACKKAFCGDTFVQAGVEICDDGNGINTDACVGCKKASCGDGHLQAGVEECDDGLNNSNSKDKCRTSCKNPGCGDGIVDSGEQCDDGNHNDGDGCSGLCATEVKKNSNGMGGTYNGIGVNKTENAKLACESHWGAGNCCNDGCGSCNDRGYHKCGTPNCNGSTYWYYKGVDQSMGCGWVSAAEVLISNDGVNWIQ